MSKVLLRESTVLLIGLVVAYITSRFGNAGRDFGALVAALLIPMAFCLIRAALVRYPTKEFSFLRRSVYQLVMGCALISLFAFEMGVAMFAGAADIPDGAWLTIGGFGMGYILLFLLAYRIGFIQRDLNSTNQPVEVES